MNNSSRDLSLRNFAVEVRGAYPKSVCFVTPLILIRIIFVQTKLSSGCVFECVCHLQSVLQRASRARNHVSKFRLLREHQQVSEPSHTD